MKYSGTNHVALATNNMDRTIRFWRDLLGMRLIAGIGNKRTRQYFFEITENMMISFFEWPDVEPVEDKDAGRPAKGALSLDHICFEVAGSDELWVLKDRLEAADVWVTEVMDNGFIHSMFATDPNNIQLEFCYSIKELNLSAKPRIVDPEMSAVAGEGSEPQHGKWPDVKKQTPPDDRKIYPGVLRALFNDEK